MKHGLKQRKLNRTSSHRLALLKNLSISLIKHETIITTTEKAKELRPFIEKLVTKAKNDLIGDFSVVDGYVDIANEKDFIWTGFSIINRSIFIFSVVRS